MLVLAITLTIILMCSQCVLFTAFYFHIKEEKARSEKAQTPQFIMSEEDFKEFKEADREQAAAINNVLANLN